MTPQEMWSSYLDSIGSADLLLPSAEYFCDNQKDADNCADLVLQGAKYATSAALAQFEMESIPLPKAGNLLIVTNWAGAAKCIIETTQVTTRRFKDVSEMFAAAEAEGDSSLRHWRDAHTTFFKRQFKGTGYEFTEDMQVVCEEFRVIFK
jgi:uncharacterized protein YhfF